MNHWISILVLATHLVLDGCTQNVPPPVTPSSIGASEKNQASAEILGEILRATYGNDKIPETISVQGLIEALSEGASREGIFRGLIRSRDYRSLEESKADVSPRMFDFFTEKWISFSESIPCAELFSESLALPLEKPDYLQGPPSQPEISPKVVWGKKSSCKDWDEPQWKTQVAEMFSHSNYFTLKRLLAERTLSHLTAMSPEKLRSWYPEWVVSETRRAIDFGIPQRNRAEKEFHARWIGKASSDQIYWEVLVRVLKTAENLQSSLR